MAQRVSAVKFKGRGSHFLLGSKNQRWSERGRRSRINLEVWAEVSYVPVHVGKAEDIKDSTRLSFESIWHGVCLTQRQKLCISGIPI